MTTSEMLLAVIGTPVVGAAFARAIYIDRKVLELHKQHSTIMKALNDNQRTVQHLEKLSLRILMKVDPQAAIDELKG